MNSTLIITIQFFLSLSLLIVLHEMGHFLAAKLFKTRVEKFYLFFDPWFSLFKKKIGGTEYGIGWLPLGGYVKISGMIDESMDKEFLDKEPQPWEFRSKPAWQRLIIMLAGIFVNLVLAMVIYIGLSYAYGEQLIPMNSLKDGVEISNPVLKEIGLKSGDKILKVNDKEIKYFNMLNPELISAKKVTIERNAVVKTIDFPVNFLGKLVDSKKKGLASIRTLFIVGGFYTDTPNKQVLKKNDEIISIEGQPTTYLDQANEILKEHKSGKVSAIVLRDGNKMPVTLSVNEDGKLGVTLQGDFSDYEKRGLLKIETKKYSFLQSIPAGWNRTKETLSNYIDQLKLIFNPSTGAYKGVGGFMAIAKAFPDHWDWARFWSFTAFLSLMLAVMNLLPIPALDGGHAMFTLYEMITGRKPNDKFLEYAQMAGFILLLTLILLVNGHDIYSHFFK